MFFYFVCQCVLQTGNDGCLKKCGNVIVFFCDGNRRLVLEKENIKIVRLQFFVRERNEVLRRGEAPGFFFSPKQVFTQTVVLIFFFFRF